MGNRNRIDLVKIAFYLLKRVWLIILCAAIGFGIMYYRAESNHRNTYTASGTMYIVNGNPNLINYQYTSMSDITSAVMLLDTYKEVVKSEKVLDAVVDRLAAEYPGIAPGYISATINMSSVNNTGVTRVSCTTDDPRKSTDICNAVMDVAPSEIKRVVGAGSVEVIDYADPDKLPGPNPHNSRRRGMTGAMAGAVIAAGVLVLLFFLNQKIEDSKELTDSYKPPLLASVPRSKKDSEDQSDFMLNEKSPMKTVESYAKLRMNLLYTLVGKERKNVIVTSAISGEGKSTIAANLAISLAMGGKRVLLVDGDMRRACQRDIFRYRKHAKGLSDVLVGECEWSEALSETNWELLKVMPAGHTPPNPADLLASAKMKELLLQLEEAFDLVLIDMPPINIVSDPLALASETAGSLFVVRQRFSDHREIRKALNSAELTGLDMLGFVFYGENIEQRGYYYYRKYYDHYYHKYDKYDTRANNRDKGQTKENDDKKSNRHTKGKKGNTHGN
ncbi:MAG: polysaccharide biosynthesis tyrosine autokinase [Clostridia bacterium]|nr:polysaccharide biosynthesis tyrosine autokinase [Clostridia bacterium]